MFVSHCFICSLFGLTPWKQSGYYLYHLLQGTGLGQSVSCIGYWVEDREIWVIFLAWARDFSSPGSPNRLWRRPSPIEWLPGPCVRDKGLGHWNLPNAHYHLFAVLKIYGELSAHPLAPFWCGAHVNTGTILPAVLRFGSHNFLCRIYLRFVWFSIESTVTFLNRINSLYFVMETEYLSLLFRKQLLCVQHNVVWHRATKLLWHTYVLCYLYDEEIYSFYLFLRHLSFT